MKKSSAVLQQGSFIELYAKGRLYAFAREYEGKKLMAVCSFDPKSRPMPINITGTVVLSNYAETASASAPLRPWEFRLIEV